MVINNPVNAQVQGLQNFNSTSGAWTGRTITSTDSSITITDGDGTAGNPNLAVNGSSVLKSLTPNSGTSPVTPTGGTINDVGTGSITTVGSANTITTQLTGLTNHAVLVGAGTATITKVGPTATTGQVLQNNAAADPTYSTATYPSTTTINQVLYSSAANTVSGLATANNGVMTTGTTGIPVITALGTDGQLIIGSSAGAPAAATLTAGSGISVTNGHNSITIAATGGGSGIVTIDGDTGSVTGSTIAIQTGLVAGTPNFSGSGTTLTLNLVDGGNNLSLGTGSADAGLMNCISIGTSAGASSSNSIAIGTSSTSQANSDISIGHSASTSGANSISIGTSANDNAGPNSITIGNGAANSYNTGSRSNVVIGNAAQVTGTPGSGGNASVVIGDGANGGSSGSIVLIGSSATSNGGSNVVIGTSITDNGTGASVLVGSGVVGPAGGYTVALGYQASSSNTGGGSNITIGNVGVAAESHVTRIGTQGAGNGQQNKCFVAGINSQNSSGFTTPLPVLVDSSTGQLGYGAIGAGGIVTINGDSGSITGSTVTIKVANPASGLTPRFFASSATELDFYLSDTNFNMVLSPPVTGFITSGQYNTGVGYQASTRVTSGSFNSFFGYIAGASGGNITGSYNLGVGYDAGSAVATGSSNVYIGNRGAIESNTIRIGTQGSGNFQQNLCYIAGIFGTTTSNAGSSTAVLIDNTGNLGTIASSIRYKENVQDIGNASTDIQKLRPVSFNYKKDTSKSTQYGLIAEEVEKTLPYLVVYDQEGRPDSVKYHELPTLLLAEVQKLRREIESLKLQIKK